MARRVGFVADAFAAIFQGCSLESRRTPPESLQIVRKIAQANAGPGPNDGLQRQAP